MMDDRLHNDCDGGFCLACQHDEGRTMTTYTQADLDQIVKAAVDYSSQAAAQEARAVALRVAEKVCRQASEKYAAFAYDRENEEGRLQNAAKCYAANEIGDTIVALLDTPAAEVLERVRAEEREATLRAAVDEIRDAPDLELARDRLIALIHSQPIRARGQT